MKNRLFADHGGAVGSGWNQRLIPGETCSQEPCARKRGRSDCRIVCANVCVLGLCIESGIRWMLPGDIVSPLGNGLVIECC